MKKILNKILTVILCLLMLIPGTGYTYAQNMETIEEIADNLIDVKIEEYDYYITKSYKNIPAFVSYVKSAYPNMSELEIGGFLIQYTGQGVPEDYDDAYLIEKASYYEINIQEEFLKKDEDGTISAATKGEALIALVNELIMPLDATYNYWSSDDGYIRIQTIYELAKTVGNKKYYAVAAKAEWLKLPICRFTDVICLANTATYDDSYNDCGRYIQKTTCCSFAGTVHYTKNLTETKYADGTGSGVNLMYDSIKAVGAEVDLRVTSCNNPSAPGGHDEKLVNMNALVRYRIICEKNKSYNIRSAYSHKELGFGGIDFSVSNNLSISFSGVLDTSDYFARIVTINA